MMSKDSKDSKAIRTSTQYDPVSRRIGNLKRERAELEEEVLQLRAAVQIWAAVCRQTMSRAADSEAFSPEMR
jgi:predicted  nucleic acid-binding Zn-ribbon protein